MNARLALAQEAARIICEELITDYGLAKRKAAERLDQPARNFPENALIQQAVIQYQHLFGGEEYHQRLKTMREVAAITMRWLDEFSPRLVGATISGAITAAHRIQLHVFADKTEMLDIFLHNQGQRFEQDERVYRYPNGREQRVPLARFEREGLGVDVAIFPEGDLRRPPLNPAEGQPFRRLDLQAAQDLAAAPLRHTGIR